MTAFVAAMAFKNLYTVMTAMTRWLRGAEAGNYLMATLVMTAWWVDWALAIPNAYTVEMATTHCMRSAAMFSVFKRVTIMTAYWVQRGLNLCLATTAPIRCAAMAAMTHWPAAMALIGRATPMPAARSRLILIRSAAPARMALTPYQGLKTFLAVTAMTASSVTARPMCSMLALPMTR